MLRFLRLARGRALPMLCVLIGIGVVGIRGAAAEVSDETRQACTGDAMRLCSDVIPDVQKVTLCMNRKRAQVSRECHAAMAREHMRFRHVGRATGHAYGRAHCHHKHCR